MATHTCHATGCTAPVPPKMFLCRAHWFRLPKSMRDEIWAVYVPGQEVRKDPAPEYLEVARRCISYLERLEERPPCDYDIGAAISGLWKCGRPAKFWWADEISKRDRPVCGIHGRSARIKWHAEVRPLTAPGSEDGA